MKLLRLYYVRRDETAPCCLQLFAAKTGSPKTIFVHMNGIIRSSQSNRHPLPDRQTTHSVFALFPIYKYSLALLKT